MKVDTYTALKSHWEAIKIKRAYVLLVMPVGNRDKIKILLKSYGDKQGVSEIFHRHSTCEKSRNYIFCDPAIQLWLCEMTEGRSDSRELRAGFSFDLSIKIEILEMLLQIKRIVLTFVVRLGVSSKSHAKKTSLLYWFQRISSGLSLTSKSWKMKGSEKKIRLIFVVRELG